MRTKGFTAVLSSALMVVGVACGGREVAANRPVSQPDVETAGVSLPAHIIGLEVRGEDISEKLETVERPFVDSVGLFSLREGDLLRATLQVSRLNSLAEPDDPSFRSKIIDQLGATRPQAIQVGKQTVYVTSGNDQNVFAWFEGRGFFVLAVHRGYPFPRTLLREILNLGKKI